MKETGCGIECKDLELTQWIDDRCIDGCINGWMDG